MRKLIRDFSILLILGFAYLLVNGKLEYGNSIAVVGGSAFFVFIAEVMRNLVEIDIENERLNKDVVKIFRDSILAFVLSYIAMTLIFGLVTFTQALPYVIAAFAPTVIVAAISKELRMPAKEKLVAEDEEIANGFVA